MDVDKGSEDEGSSMSNPSAHVQVTELEAVPNEDAERCAQRAVDRVLGQIHASPLDTGDKTTAMEFAHKWREGLNRGLAEYIATFDKLIRDRSGPHGETPDPSQLSANAYVNVLNGTIRITMSALNPTYGEDRARLWEGTVPLAISPTSEEMFVCTMPDDDGKHVVFDALTNAESWFRLSELDRVLLDRGEFEVEVSQGDTAMDEPQQPEGSRRRDYSAYLTGQHDAALDVKHARGAIQGAKAAWERELNPRGTETTAEANVDEAAQALSLALQSLRVGFHHPSYNPEPGRFSVRVGAKHLKTQNGEIVPYPAWSIVNHRTDQSIRRSGHHPVSFASDATGARRAESLVEIVPPLAPPIPAVPGSAPMPHSPHDSPLSSLTSTPSIEAEELPSGPEPVRRMMTRSHARLGAVQVPGPSRVESSPPFGEIDASTTRAQPPAGRPLDSPGRSRSPSAMTAEMTVATPRLPRPQPETPRQAVVSQDVESRLLPIPSFPLVSPSSADRDPSREITVRYKTELSPGRNNRYRLNGSVELVPSGHLSLPDLAGNDKLRIFKERDLGEFREPSADISLKFGSARIESEGSVRERWKAFLSQNVPTREQLGRGAQWWYRSQLGEDRQAVYHSTCEKAIEASDASFGRFLKRLQDTSTPMEPDWKVVPRIVHRTPTGGSNFLLFSWAVLNGEKTIARSVDDAEHSVTVFGRVKAGQFDDRDPEP